MEKLPGAVHSEGYVVLDKNEVTDIKHTRAGYLRFMHSKEQAPLIADFWVTKISAYWNGKLTLGPAKST